MAERASELPPELTTVPQHVAIIMDGNGRWARARLLPRYVGHREGVKSVRRAVEACIDRHIEVLTLFAFSSENWRRPSEEVSLIMDLFVQTLKKEVASLNRNGVRVRFIGDRNAFSEKLVYLITEAERETRDNSRLQLVIAANYGGQWDISQAVRTIATRVQAGELSPQDIDPDVIAAEVALSELPPPDLFIRTGGERRISNFLLWQLSYAELYVTDVLWPDFRRRHLLRAIGDYQKRERRYGGITTA